MMKPRRGSNSSQGSRNRFQGQRAASAYQKNRQRRSPPQELYQTESIYPSQPYPDNQFYNEQLAEQYNDAQEGFDPYYQNGQMANEDYYDEDEEGGYQGPSPEDFGYNSVRIGEKNLRVRDITGYQKQPKMYSSMRGINPKTDAYFYPNPNNMIHPCKPNSKNSEKAEAKEDQMGRQNRPQTAVRRQPERAAVHGQQQKEA